MKKIIAFALSVILSTTIVFAQSDYEKQTATFSIDLAKKK